MTGPPRVVRIGGGATAIPVADPTGPGGARAGLGALHDVDGAAVLAAPAGPPLIWRKAPDGVLRPERLQASDVGDHEHPRWGEEIRIGAGDPDTNPDADGAPTGAVYLDYQTGTIYERAQT